MTDKRTKQKRRAKYKSDARRDVSYEILKLMAAADGVPLPNNQNGGVELDEWLSNKLAQLKC